MNTKKYEKEILLELIHKLNVRGMKYGDKDINRSIFVKPKDFYKNYGTAYADSSEEKTFNEEVSILETNNFVKVNREKFSDDIKRISLNTDSESEINDYLEKEFAVTPRYIKQEKAKGLIERYKDSGELTKYYGELLLSKVEHTVNDIDIEKEEKYFNILNFIQSNKDDLYVREVYMIVYGSSKLFEEQPFYNSVCSIIRNALDKPVDDDFAIDDILKDYHIYNIDQGILLKGDIAISISGYELSIKKLSNGISLTSSDIPLIDYIKVDTEKFMTIENKTAFYRFNDKDFSVLYLGGYANRYQIDLLKKIIIENPDIGYYHFGDIDAGGFYIHQHLCKITGTNFELYHMNVEELHNPAYMNCLSELTENDRIRIKSLSEIEPYKEVAKAMLDENVKLEQEIVCLNLVSKDAA